MTVRRNFRPSWSGADGRAWGQSKIVNTLRQAAGGWVKESELAEALYGGSVGPVNTRGAIHMLVHLLRKRGFPIVSGWGRGYRYAPELVQQPAIQPFTDISALSLMARRNPTADASAPAVPSGIYGEFSVRR